MAPVDQPLRKTVGAHERATTPVPKARDEVAKESNGKGHTDKVNGKEKDVKKEKVSNVTATSLALVLVGLALAALLVYLYVEAMTEGGVKAILESPLYQAFANSFVMIIATELGDKTFFIAAILAMRKDRRLVFLGAAGALAAMTVLSAVIGKVLPAILPPQYTHRAATLLFVYFGIRLIHEAYEMFSSGTGAGPSDELDEVEKTLQDGKHSKSTVVEAFMLTFLAEWGDRSQIATIALAAAKCPFGVTLGGVVGHGCCTGLAVLGGRVVATSISERAMLAIGGILFLIFAVHGALVGFS
jgi:putative Ca2+/H+ antiporter (TMEM165/GDT1 family)